MAKPANPFDEDQISVIEDLDPEDGRGGKIRFDLLLGIPLILTVVLFAGWQWWHNDYVSGQYRAGQEAAGRNDWEAASIYFAEASGYNDADAQASGARAKIEERDQLYGAIVSNSMEENWIAALRDIRAAAKIQPDYKDLAQREKSTLDNIYSGILSGTVALRVEANPAGLYLRTASGWNYLKGSDKYSGTRVAPMDGQVVYDAPDPGWEPPVEAYPSANEVINLRGRHLVHAQYKGGHIEYMDLSLDPSQYTALVPSKDGIWGVHYGNGGVGYSSIRVSVVRNSYNYAEVAYQPFSADTIGYAPLPPLVNDYASIVALDTHSNRYLLAGWNESSSQGPTKNTIVSLYLVVAGSNATRVIYTHEGGGIVSAQFDPTGRYVLVHTFDAHGFEVNEPQQIVLVDLEAGRTVTQGDPVAKATLLRSAVVNSVIEGSGQTAFGATFVEGGPFAGDIVLTQFKDVTTTVQVVDPRAAVGGESGVIAAASTLSYSPKGWAIGSDNKTALFILGFNFQPSFTLDNTLDVITLDAGGKVKVKSFDAPSTSYPMAAQYSKYGFEWSSYKYVQNVIPNESNVFISVYSTSEGQLAAGVISPTTAFTQGLQHTEITNPQLAPSIVLGDSFFAFSYQNKLHLRSYDGKDDLILESGVGSIQEQIQDGSAWTYVR